MDSKYSIESTESKVQNNKLFKRKGTNSQNEHSSPKKMKPSTSKDSGFGSPTDKQSTNTQNTQNHGQKHHAVNMQMVREQRQALPSFNVRQSLIEKVKKNPTLIILGETGCGKTTQIPQYLYETGLNRSRIIGITQPRRVAAITIAKRVAMEKNCAVGELVGYAVRFEDMTSDSTKIKYMTDGTLLREALSDRLLIKYSIIILDEAHERTLSTDVLFGIVKTAQLKRKQKQMEPLKIIVMSATMDVDHFHQYFPDSTVAILEGRMFSVKVHSPADDVKSYSEIVYNTIFQIHEDGDEKGDILVFLTGQEEIENMASHIRATAKTLDHNKKLPKLVVFTIYAALPQEHQMAVFNPTTTRTRKVILATNIAETSITIPGIKYVIDSGRVKVRTYDSVTGVDTLKIEHVSQAQAWQRTGRAGRVEAGHSYRAFTQKDFDAMDKMPKPEILRSNLSSVALQLAALGIDIRKFDFLNKPPTDACEAAIKELKSLGAVEMKGESQLTVLGRKMARLPLDPKYGKMLMSATEFGCLEEILTIVSMLSSENVFVNSPNKKDDQRTAHAKFASKYGDHMTLLNVYNQFRTKTVTKQWCYENFLHDRSLVHVQSVRHQLSTICHELGIEPSSCDNDYTQITKCLLTGLYNNIAELQADNSYMVLASRQKAQICPASSLYGKKSPFVLFSEIITTSKNNLRNVTEVEPHWVAETSPNCSFLNRLKDGHFQNGLK